MLSKIFLSVNKVACRSSGVREAAILSKCADNLLLKSESINVALVIAYSQDTALKVCVCVCVCVCV